MLLPVLPRLNPSPTPHFPPNEAPEQISLTAYRIPAKETAYHADLATKCYFMTPFKQRGTAEEASSHSRSFPQRLNNQRSQRLSFPFPQALSPAASTTSIPATAAHETASLHSETTPPPIATVLEAYSVLTTSFLATVQFRQAPLLQTVTPSLPHLLLC